MNGSILYSQDVLEFFLADSGFFAGKITKVEDSCPAYLTMLIDFNLVNERGGNGKYSLNTNVA